MLDIKDVELFAIEKLKKYKKGKNYTISFEENEWGNDPRILDVWKNLFKTHIQRINNIEPYVRLEYNSAKLYIYEENSMDYKVTINIDYGNRNKYIDLIYDVNKIVGSNGMMLLVANNNIYNLEFMIVVQSSKLDEIKDVESLANSLNLDITQEVGFKEVITGMANKQYNHIGLPNDCNKETIVEFMSMIAFYKTKDDLDIGKVKEEKKKIFISYSHKDKNVVREIVDNLKYIGFNMWIDENEMDIGDNIIERVNDGINECDLSIIFLSKNTLGSCFAKHELRTFFQKIIYESTNKSSWFIVRLDNVNVDDIYNGLGGYMYYQIDEDIDYEDFARKIKKKL